MISMKDFPTDSHTKFHAVLAVFLSIACLYFGIDAAPEIADKLHRIFPKQNVGELSQRVYLAAMVMAAAFGLIAHRINCRWEKAQALIDFRVKLELDALELDNRLKEFQLRKLWSDVK